VKIVYNIIQHQLHVIININAQYASSFGCGKNSRNYFQPMLHTSTWRAMMD